MPKHAQKHPPIPHLDAFMRNSLPTAALIREILYSHSLPRREILVNLSQKIAKLQHLALFCSTKSNISPDSAGLNQTPHLGRKKRRPFDSRPCSLVPCFLVPSFPRSLGPCFVPIRVKASRNGRLGKLPQLGPFAQDLQFPALTPTIRIRNRPAKQVGDQRWLNQHSMNRGSTRQSVLCAVSASPECLMNRGELHRLRTGSPAHRSRPSGPGSTSSLRGDSIF
jgi:hypothetical protein